MQALRAWPTLVSSATVFRENQHHSAVEPGTMPRCFLALRRLWSRGFGGPRVSRRRLVVADNRHNLTIRLSCDEGRTWDAGSLLLREGNGQYTSMALLTNGRVGVFYDCWENQNYQLYFTTFSPDELR